MFDIAGNRIIVDGIEFIVGGGTDIDGCIEAGGLEIARPVGAVGEIDRGGPFLQALGFVEAGPLEDPAAAGGDIAVVVVGVTGVVGTGTGQGRRAGVADGGCKESCLFSISATLTIR